MLDPVRKAVERFRSGWKVRLDSIHLP